jgi:hypothetical protein
MAAVGTTGLTPTTVIVRPGSAIQLIGALLDTAPCRNAPSPATCDDRVIGNTIVAGANGIAETEARNEVASLPLRLNSVWRNPQRNEAAGGVRTSRHQFGNAIDLDITAAAAGKTIAQLFCILQTAADTVGSAFAERLSTQVDCNDPTVTHVHVQDNQVRPSLSFSGDCLATRQQ